MVTFSFVSFRLLSVTLLSVLLPLHILAQKPKLKSTSWRDNWKLEFKTGVGSLVSPVPEKYLDKINNVNIPLFVPGPMGVFSFKKGITSRLEMGYQFDILRIQGKVDVRGTDIKVLTQAYTHSYLVQFNLRETNDFKPLFNYFLNYKIGGVSLKNEPQEKLPDETDQAVVDSEKKYASNVAVLTGIGLGMNYQLSNNLSLTGSFDLNRSSDSAGDALQIQKLFYNSPNTVNSYIALSVGLSYWFNFSKTKASSYFKARTETEKLLLQSKIEKKKGRSSAKNNSDWYNYKKGR